MGLSAAIAGLLYVRDGQSQVNHDWSEVEQDCSWKFEH